MMTSSSLPQEVTCQQLVALQQQLQQPFDDARAFCGEVERRLAEIGGSRATRKPGKRREKSPSLTPWKGLDLEEEAVSGWSSAQRVYASTAMEDKRPSIICGGGERRKYGDGSGDERSAEFIRQNFVLRKATRHDELDLTFRSSSSGPEIQNRTRFQRYRPSIQPTGSTSSPCNVSTQSSYFKFRTSVRSMFTLFQAAERSSAVTETAILRSI